MISKVISISKKINLRLDNHFARLLYTWLIPHTDDFGRLTGCPHKVKALVIPMLDDTWKDVEKALQSLHDVELIQWYEVNGELYIQLTNFDGHQSGLHKRTKSKIPNPPELPGNSRNFTEIPLEGKGREQNRREEEGKGTPLTFDPYERIQNLFNIHHVEDYILHHINVMASYIGMVEFEVIEHAIKKGAHKHANYCVRTLEGLVKDGKLTKESVEYKTVTPLNNREAETQKRLAEERKTAEPVPLEPEIEALKEVAAGYESPGPRTTGSD